MSMCYVSGHKLAIIIHKHALCMPGWIQKGTALYIGFLGTDKSYCVNMDLIYVCPPSFCFSCFQRVTFLQLMPLQLHS